MINDKHEEAFQCGNYLSPLHIRVGTKLVHQTTSRVHVSIVAYNTLMISVDTMVQACFTNMS